MINAKELISVTKDLHVLYVEDDHNLRENTCKILNTLFHKVTTAENGVDALAKLNVSQVDLVISDLMMPKMNGIELCEHIRTQDRNLPIIVISATSESSYLVDLINNSVDSFLMKPLDITKFNRVVYKVCSHIHNRKQAEEANRKLIILAEELKQSNFEKDRFFSIISHDLKTPFTALVGVSELLRDRADTMTKEEISSFSGDIFNASTNFLHLLENLLDWSRLQLGKMQVNEEKININGLFTEAFGLLIDLAKNKSIQLINNVSEDHFCWADKRMIYSVIHNLLTNAIKFTPIDGLITVEIQKKNQLIETKVMDTGVGISPEDMKKLFKLDQKISRTGTGEEIGTGLGLNLCREMLSMNQGEIRVESELGNGSAFIFTLPEYNGNQE